MADEAVIWIRKNVRIGVFRRDLVFKRPARTSRDVLTRRPVWYVLIADGDRIGVGECAPVFGLSPENPDELSAGIASLREVGDDLPDLSKYSHLPSLRFALDMACRQLTGGPWTWFQPASGGWKSIPINGLVWMNPADQMLSDAGNLVEKGFTCIKFKVGALDFDQELTMLSEFRKKFDISTIEVRLDANGAFLPQEVEEKMRRLSEFGIHSIEQPVKPLHKDVLAKLSKEQIIPVALDEQLIGVHTRAEKEILLRSIMPQYIVIKPTLVGGFDEAMEWTMVARELGIESWVTSMLESNAGLTAIAQWVALHGTRLPQGLGTGSLYENNLEGPVEISGGHLTFIPERIPFLPLADEIQRSGIRVF